MERWEYAAGHEDLNGNFVASTEPGTYEKARIDLDVMMRRHEDEDWMITPAIIKRSDRHPTWARVHDHAAELLAEIVHDMAYRFSNFGAGIIQGYDLVKTLRKVAEGVSDKLPQNVEEYGE